MTTLRAPVPSAGRERPGLLRRFPRTAAAFASLGDGDRTLRQLVELEASFGRRDGRERRDAGPGGAAVPVGDDTFDVVLAGGGLSLIYAATLARMGLRVAVFDHRRIGCGHREWNISRPELDPLVASGLFSQAEVEQLVRMQYRVGICRFADGDRPGPSFPVGGVLDCVIDAERLLAELRERAERAGATLLDHHSLDGYQVRPDRVDVVVRPTAGPGPLRLLRGRLLIDALGAGSPHARFDLCCPTVGGVMAGLRRGSGPAELDPAVGEILVTTEGVEDGQQHIWEGFPSPPADEAAGPETSDRMTIYLFYYQRAAEVAAAVAAGEHPLLSLYERFFATLGRYKVGAAGQPPQFVRPTFGYIPAYTRLGPMPAAAERVLLVGDAAARHSPLTFCGFGSMIRSFLPISQGVQRLLAADRLGRADLDGLWQGLSPPALSVMGGLTLMMMPPPAGALEDPDGINQLLTAAFGALAALGDSAYGAFLRDSVDAPTFMRFMLQSAAVHPAVYQKVFAHLSPGEIATWLVRLLRFRFSSEKSPAISS